MRIQLTFLIIIILFISSIAKVGIGYSNQGPLPVELSLLTAFVKDGAVIIKWETVTEINNYGFEVQKLSIDNKDSTWISIGFVEGSGTSNSHKEYFFIDEFESGLEIICYRLKQIDQDGKVSYSKEISLSLVSNSEMLPNVFNLYQNYPNPFNPTTKIKFAIPQESLGGSSNVVLKLFDILGREVAILINKNLDAGFYEIELNAEGLSSGMYFYQLIWNGKSLTKKLMLTK